MTLQDEIADILRELPIDFDALSPTDLAETADEILSLPRIKEALEAKARFTFPRIPET